MSKELTALRQLNKAADLTNRAFHKNGPKSYKKGQGALLKVLHTHGGEMTSRELVDTLGYDRGKLKDIVRKAQRNGYAEIADSDEKRTYIVKITQTGDEIAEKRCAAHTKTAAEILSGLTDEEIDQLNTLTEKIIVKTKEMGAKGKHKKGKKHHHGHPHGHKRH